MSLIKALNQQQAASHLDRYFQRIQMKSQSKPIQIRIYSRRMGLDYIFPANSTNQPYHIASIGKLFTATLIQMLAERGSLSIKDPVQRYLSRIELDNLFVYQNINHAGQVTIEHLLGHTSGIADYFEGKTTDGKTFLYEILSNPQHHWTPQELLEYTRHHQTAVGSPGQVFAYSDTGYILLGLIIEKVTGKSFAHNLADHIFQPLDMRDSYLMFHAEPINAPKRKIEKIWFDHVEVSSFESLSCDWSGGGIVSTTADLLLFDQALRGGRLIECNTLQNMDACPHRFRPGIYYGLGMMEIHFREFFFLLGSLPKVKGHIGILATHLFYDPLNDAHIIMNFAANTRMVESFKALIEIENTFKRMR